MSIKIKYLTDSKIRSLPIQNKEALLFAAPNCMFGFIQMAANILISLHISQKIAYQTHWRLLWFNHIVSSPYNA